MQLKKIFAIFLAATLIFSVFAVSASAENVETLKVGVVAETATPISDIPQIFNQGDEVSYKISVEQNTGISLFCMYVYFDTNAYEYVGHESVGLFEPYESIDVKDGYIQFKLVCKENEITTATGDLFTLTLKAKEGFCGEASVYTQLRQNLPENCIRYDDVVFSKAVPFEGGSSTVAIHNIVAEDGVVTAPTCLDEGFTTYKCNSCEKDVVGNIVPATGHFEAEPVVENKVEATCLENGSYDSVVYCSVCEAELSREQYVIDAEGHDLSTTEAKEPTCTEIGWGAYDTCSKCDYTTYVEIPANGHTKGEVVVENNVDPTCTANGSYDNVIYCSVCKVELSRETVTVDALGHTLVTVEAKDPTCTEIGWDAYEECSVCDYSTYVEKDALGHKAADVVQENLVEATCTTAGSYESVVYCSICKEELSREKKVIDALGHDLSTTEAKEPTCTEIGWGAYDTCLKCDYTTYVEIPANGHTKGEVVVENNVDPTCTVNGSYDNVVYCSACKVELSRETVTVDALGHTLVSVEAKDPTCTEIGWDAYEECSVCDYSTYVEKDALGHKAADVVQENLVEATCTTAGSYENVVYCSICKEELSREEKVIDALGHDLVQHEAKEPTCTEIGWDAYEECTVCDHTTYVEKSALGHTFGDVTVVEPEYMVDGYSTHTCTVCGHEEKFDITPALTYIAGDANSDGVVNNKDLGLLMQHLNDWDVEVNSDAADVNGDGVVNNKDYGLLMQYLNDWDVELG